MGIDRMYGLRDRAAMTSRYRGVSYNKRSKTFLAKFSGKILGSGTELECAKIYDGRHWRAMASNSQSPILCSDQHTLRDVRILQWK